MSYVRPSIVTCERLELEKAFGRFLRGTSSSRPYGVGRKAMACREQSDRAAGCHLTVHRGIGL